MEELTERHNNSPRENLEEWGGAEAVHEDPDEQRVLFAALDSFQ
jgi:hypothetical protein